MSSRSYKQFCGLARALDVVGDRWNLLIVRNLIIGPLTWGEMRDHLPGIAKNLLSARLSQLESDGVIVRRDGRYALTAHGRHLEPALFALAAWGETHGAFRATSDEAIRLRYFMTSLKGRLRSQARTSRLCLDIDGELFAVTLGPAPTVETIAQPRHDGAPHRHRGPIIAITFAELRAVVFANAAPRQPRLVPLAKALAR